jgi:hypothetical protein
MALFDRRGGSRVWSSLGKSRQGPMRWKAMRMTRSGHKRPDPLKSRHMTCYTQSPILDRGNKSMRRREFITLIGGAALVQPFETRAQQSLATIGFLHEGLPESSSLKAAFRQGLIEAGFGEGRSIAIENRWAEDQYAGYRL